jgi:hypothetical protein
VCVATLGLGWWAAVKAADRVTRVAARLDEGLADADSGLAGVEERVAGAIYIDVWGHPWPVFISPFVIRH